MSSFDPRSSLEALAQRWEAEADLGSTYERGKGRDEAMRYCAKELRALDAALAAQPALRPDCRFMRPPQDRPCAEVYPEDQTRWCGTCLLAALARPPKETP